MENKISETISNICTILGGALLLYPIIDQATKTLAPELQKLADGKAPEVVKALTDGKEEKPKEEKKTEEPEEPEQPEQIEKEKPQERIEYRRDGC